MNAPTPAAHLQIAQRDVPAAFLEALKARFGDNCSTAQVICEQHGRDESAFTTVPRIAVGPWDGTALGSSAEPPPVPPLTIAALTASAMTTPGTSELKSTRLWAAIATRAAMRDRASRLGTIFIRFPCLGVTG